MNDSPVSPGDRLLLYFVDYEAFGAYCNVDNNCIVATAIGGGGKAKITVIIVPVVIQVI